MLIVFISADVLDEGRSVVGVLASVVMLIVLVTAVVLGERRSVVGVSACV